MKIPTMIYRHPGRHKIGKKFYDYKVVDAADVDSFLSDGWFRTPAEAEACEILLDDEPPTRGELEIKATELGIDFDGRTTDRKLLERINEKLANDMD